MNSEELLSKLTESLDDKKAINIKALEIKGLSNIADYFLICSAANPNQLRTLVESCEETFEKLGQEYRTEGRGGDSSEWVLIDNIDVIVHIFTEEAREFYNIEHMWQDGSFVDIEKFLPSR